MQGIPVAALEEPKLYDFDSSDYWRAVDNAWEMEKRNKENNKFCYLHFAYNCWTCARNGD